MYQYQPEDSPLNDFISYVVAASTTYLLGTWQKKAPNSMIPTVVGIPVGIAAFAGRHFVNRPTIKSSLEAVGYGTAGWGGVFAASNTKTIGSIGAEAMPMNRIVTPAAGGVRRAGAVIDARRRGGGGYQPAPQPSISPWDADMLAG